MNTPFDIALAFVLTFEGDYSDDSQDPGGKTKWGISQAAFPNIDLDTLTKDLATKLYHTQYWVPVHGDSLPPSVAMVVFDAAVNQGVYAATIMLQEAAGTTQDGIIGPVTIAAAKAFDPAVLIQEICARRAVRYAAGDMQRYGLGWMRRIFAVAAASELLTRPV